MVVNKAFGATCTLQRFYAATGYAAVPLLLTGLAPVACFGWLATLAGVGWAVAVYIRADQDISGLPLLQAALASVLPILVLLFVSVLLVLIFVGTVFFVAV